MLLTKVAAENPPTLVPLLEVVVRKYDEDRDKAAVEDMERRCELGQHGKPSLVTDLMGDPMCRIRHFPTHIMLVAEYGEEDEIVGVIRGCVKEATRGNSVFVKLAYILGLRVSPTHRRLGIGTKLVTHLEEWCKQNGATYAYMATDCTNEASINLFTIKCAYQKFRTPTVLVQPVHAHYKPISSTNIAIVQLPTSIGESIYGQLFAQSEFFPKDVDTILSSNLNLGTFIALPRKSLAKWDPHKGTLPPSFAILSVWNTKEVFKLQVKGVSPLTYACCVITRLVDAWLPWLRLPSFPNVFKQFGVYFMYGLHMEGKNGKWLMKALCNFVHNMAKDDHGCAAVVAEVGQGDPVRGAIPSWRKFSWAEDMWCVKKLGDQAKQGEKKSSGIVCDQFDWISTRSSSSVIFVDPRHF